MFWSRHGHIEPTEENTLKPLSLFKMVVGFFATETVYGLGANALDASACEKIFIAKERPHYDPLIVHIADVDQISEVVSTFSDKAQAAAKAFWPGSLTMVLPKKDIISDSITANMPTVAVRVPKHPVATHNDSN